MNIKNCKICGKMFRKTFRDICPACQEEDDKTFEQVVDYLKKNSSAGLSEISAYLNINPKQIKRFVEEGRLSESEALKNVEILECKICGEKIKEGNFCSSCNKKLINGWTDEDGNANKKDIQADDGRAEIPYDDYESIHKRAVRYAYEARKIKKDEKSK